MKPRCRRALALAALCFAAIALAGAVDGDEPIPERVGEIQAAPSPEPAPVAEPVMEAPPVTDAPPAEEAPPVVAAAPVISAGILVDGLQYGLAMPWGDATFEKYREEYLSTGGRKWLAAVMEKSLPYLSYVQERLEFHGLPRELEFLPVIESEYSPQAVSKSGATGLWQFMRNSINGYGMKIDDWVDERRDFMKSTDGALRKLKDNHDTFGDWALALAAYNAGMGAVARALRQAGEGADFWSLSAAGKLTKEARSYVPKFLAVASILSYPELHGLPSEWGGHHAWEALETDRQVDLALLSQRTGIPFAVLKSGNAELRYHITPPVDAHLLKVPADQAEAAKAVLDDRSAALIRYTIYKVKAGDTMGQVAKRHGTPLSMIVQANPGLKPDRIQIGQTVMIPVIAGSGAAAPAAAPSIEQAAAKTPQAGTGTAYSGSYTIRYGDTLSSIALRFGVQARTLAEANGLTLKSTLVTGRKLKVPPARPD